MIVDYYGNEIREDSRVAFNYSGEVRLGWVEEVGTPVVKNKWHTDHRIVIRHQGDKGRTSVVTSPRNLVVLA